MQSVYPLRFPDIIQAPSKIADRLYLGDFHDASSAQSMRSINATHIVNLCPEEKTIPKFPWITYYQVDIQDTIFDNLEPVLLKYPPIIHEVLRDPKNTVFVHCAWGISRSASLIIGILIYSFNMKFLPALNYVRSKRFIVLPNPRFLKTLGEYEKYIEESREASKLQ